MAIFRFTAAAASAIVGLACGVTLTLLLVQPDSKGPVLTRELNDARTTISILKRQLAQQQPGLRCSSDTAASPASAVVPVAAADPSAQRWDDTPLNRQLREALLHAANARKEVMLTLANDVMMCSNRKTCWWNGGNIVETFLKASKRLQLRNVVVINLDDATQSFCTSFGGATCLRMELPVPTAQQGSRGANMISTLKYGLLRQALFMGFSILVVDLDLVFLKVWDLPISPIISSDALLLRPSQTLQTFPGLL